MPLTEGVTWGPSQKQSNPSPNIVVSAVCGNQQVYCGTAARWAAQSGVLYPGIDVYAYQVVAADPAQRKLRFFTHYVNHRVDVGEVNIYGGNSPDGPWELIWTPLFVTESELFIPESRDQEDLWQETGYLEWDFAEGYSYYKIELHSRLPDTPDGILGAGFKITGIYFSTDFTDEPGSPAPTPDATSAEPAGEDSGQQATRPTTEAPSIVTEESLPTPAGVSPSPTERPTRVAGEETGNTLETMPSLTVDTTSQSEIFLTFSTDHNNTRGFRLERSLNADTGWTTIAHVRADSSQFIDSGLLPDTEYYYRLRVSSDTVSVSVSAKTLPASTSTPIPESVEEVSAVLEENRPEVNPTEEIGSPEPASQQDDISPQNTNYLMNIVLPLVIAFGVISLLALIIRVRR